MLLQTKPPTPILSGSGISSVLAIGIVKVCVETEFWSLAVTTQGKVVGKLILSLSFIKWLFGVAKMMPIIVKLMSVTRFFTSSFF